MSAPGTKSVSVLLGVDALQNDSGLFPVPGESHSAEEIRAKLAERYATSSGRLEAALENDQIRVAWRPEYIDVNAESLHRDAVQLAKKRQFQSAAVKWRQAMSVNPADAEYSYHLGLVLYEQKLFAESAKALEHSLSVCPIQHKAHLILGIDRLKLRRYEAAEASFIESVRLKPFNAFAFLNLGAVYSVQKRFNEAIGMFNKAIQLTPRESRAFLGLAKIYVHLNDHETANAYFRKVLELTPEGPMAEFARQSIVDMAPGPAAKASPGDRLENLSRGIGSYLSNRFSEASTHYREFLKTQPSDDYAWYLLGETQLRMNRTEEALDAFRKSARLNGKRGLYAKAQGLAHYLQKRHEEAADQFKKAIELGKTDPLVLTLYGICLARTKRQDEAVHQFKLSMKKNPNNPLAMVHTAMSFLQRKENQKAAELLEKISALEYFTPIKEQSRKLLKSSM